MKKLIILSLAVTFVAINRSECQEDLKLADVNIRIDVRKTVGEIPREVAGIMTDPPRPEWLKKHLLSLGMAGNKEAIEMHAGGANAFWLPVLKPTFMNLGWGGDTWYLFDTWPAEGEYYWDRLDTWIESHIERGASSLSLVLSLVPRWLWSEDAPEEARAAAGFFPYLKRGHVLPPADYGKYEELIYQTVRHLNVEKKYGVKFSVWNEPNVKFWQGTQEQLLEISEHTAKAVKRADPATLVGGPATAQLAPDWIEAFVQHFADNDLPLDFISWHYYYFYAKQYGHVLNFKQQIDLVNEIIKKHPTIGNPKLYITEWAYDWKASDLPGPTFNGAYVAQSLYEMIEGGVDGATYCGNLGFLDSPDPAAQTFKFFNKLEDSWISAKIENEASGIGILATGRNGRIALMAWNFSPDDANDKRKGQLVSIYLNNLDPDNYQIRRHLVDSDHYQSVEADIVEDKSIHSDGGVILNFKLQPYAITLVELNGSGSG